MTTNFTIHFWDEEHEPIGVAYAHYFIHAVAISQSMPNAYISDFETGELLRMQWHGEVTWASYLE